MIPFVDLKQQYLSIKNEIDAAIFGVLENTAFIGGDHVKTFERNFANFNNVSHAVSCANGTDSIEILLKVMGVKQGDEVIVPAISWISTSESVTSVGATPVFVDIEPDFFTIDTAKIEAAITPKTKVIIPVHLYGQACDMDAIMKIADKYKLQVLEDCAQAHGAMWGGELVGSIGHAASFSFYPGKNLGAYGDAGMMVTNDKDMATMARMIANHGQVKKNDHHMEGRNSRLDGLQAAVLNVKLPHLNKWNEQRLSNALLYNRLLAYCKGIITPTIKENSKHVFHVYCIRTTKRDELKAYLEAKGISTAIHYPTALPNMKAYEYLNNTPDKYPVATAYQNEILSLPMFPELTKEQIDEICKLIKSFTEN